MNKYFYVIEGDAVGESMKQSWTTKPDAGGAPSAASRLAAVARIVWPGVHFLPGYAHKIGSRGESGDVVIVRGVNWEGKQNDLLRPDSLDTYATLLRAMTPGQRERFDSVFDVMFNVLGDWKWTDALTADPITHHLPAAEFAVGIQ